MKPKTAFLYAGSIWQLLRFTALVLFFVIVIVPFSGTGMTALLLWPATAQLALASAFFFVALNPTRYGIYKNILVLGKALEAAVGFFLLVYQAATLFLGVGRPLFVLNSQLEQISGTTIQGSVFFYYSLVVVVLLDLIFLFVLISLRLSVKEVVEAPLNTLPEMAEIRLEEE